MELVTPSDADEITRSLAEPEAFRVIFDRHFDAVWSYLRHRLGAGLADDATSETFAQAFATRNRFHGADAPALPWLLGIGANLAARHWRAESRRLRAYSRTGVATPGDLDEDGLLARICAVQQSREIAAAVASLRPEDRETLLLSALAGLDNHEVATALGISPNAVGVRLHRIRGRLSHVIPNPTLLRGAS
jgi:RNA polymerase sigma factor (sigma-70 family)